MPINPTWPANGTDPWGDALRTQLGVVVDAVNANEADIGGLPVGGENGQVPTAIDAATSEWAYPVTLRQTSLTGTTAIVTATPAGQVQMAAQGSEDVAIFLLATDQATLQDADGGTPLDSSASPAGIVVHADIADVVREPVAALDTVGWGRTVFIENGGTVPVGTPEYTIVVELEA